MAQDISWTPWSRLYLQAGLNYVLSETKTPASDYTQAVLPAQNNYWTVNVSTGLVLDDKTDLKVSFFYYLADDYQNNSLDGVPYGSGEEHLCHHRHAHSPDHQEYPLVIEVRVFPLPTTLLTADTRITTPISCIPACNTGSDPSPANRRLRGQAFGAGTGGPKVRVFASAGWLCWRIVGALWEPWGGFKVALRSHWGGFGVATAWLSTRIEVALMSH